MAKKLVARIETLKIVNLSNFTPTEQKLITYCIYDYLNWGDMSKSLINFSLVKQFLMDGEGTEKLLERIKDFGSETFLDLEN
jgi:hypothetical protein